jgi:uncharacterized membrane protein
VDRGQKFSSPLTVFASISRYYFEGGRSPMLRNTDCQILFTMLLSVTAQAADTFISFDVPGATSTRAIGINADGAVVGDFVDSAGTHGYLLNGGNFTKIDYPNAFATSAKGINSQGDIVGSHTDDSSGAPSAIHGFLLHQGTFTGLNYPGRLGLIPQRINDAGQIVGCNHDNDLNVSMHGFRYSNGDWSELGMGMSMNNGLLPDGSLVTGLFTDPMTNTSRAYFTNGGDPIPFDFPFAAATWAWDMNPSGQIVGQYTDTVKTTHGFLLAAPVLDSTFGFTPAPGEPISYQFISIDYPGAKTTYAYGINTSGHIVGAYVDSVGKQHGFVLLRGHHRDQ